MALNCISVYTFLSFAAECYNFKTVYTSSLSLTQPSVADSDISLRTFDTQQKTNVPAEQSRGL